MVDKITDSSPKSTPARKIASKGRANVNFGASEVTGPTDRPTETQITTAHAEFDAAVTVGSRYDKESFVHVTRHFPGATSGVEVSVVTGVKAAD
ncbi:MAG TPA: hypothetical protein VKA66_01835 [Mycobacterium sp.]|nr:hypothetical protein [Mycobacterium sp.]